MEKSEYIEFMCNPNNIGNCENCPERCMNNSTNLPCGQYHCWVELHCEESEDD